MMLFEMRDEDTAVAANSLKKVVITRFVTNKYDRNLWMVYTPEGRLYDDFYTSGPFESFNSAQRDAELNVGVYAKIVKTDKPNVWKEG